MKNEELAIPNSYLLSPSQKEKKKNNLDENLTLPRTINLYNLLSIFIILSGIKSSPILPSFFLDGESRTQPKMMVRDMVRQEY